MALKGSGVRASSAPSQSLSRFSSRRTSAAFFSLSLFSVFVLFFIGIFLCGSSHIAFADKAQIGILVSPQGNNIYRVALSYEKRVNPSKVRQEIDALAQNTQGSLIGQPLIQDYSLDPSQLKLFPVTTSAIFLLSYNSAGNQTFQSLPAYLEAFRHEKHLQILFVSSGEGGERQNQEFTTPELKVTLTRSQGVERYDARILSDKGTLPVPVFAVSQNRVQEIPKDSANKPVESSGGSISRILLVLLGGLGAGIAIYLIATRFVLAPKAAK